MNPVFGRVHRRDDKIAAIRGAVRAPRRTTFMGSALAVTFAGTLTAGAALAGAYGASAAGIGHAALSLASLGALLAAIVVATVLDSFGVE